MQRVRLNKKMACSCGAIALSLALMAAPMALAQETGVINSINVEGSQRIEADTVRSYIGLSVGDQYSPAALDAAFKRLFATGLFADVTIRSQAGRITVNVVENPIINRIVFEGNKAIKNDDLNEEVRLQPRQVYTRAKVRADVQRIIELYRRKGRFAASVEPKIIQLEQNRVDLVFEIAEGQKSRVRKINMIGNRDFSDGDLRGEIATRESRWWRLFTSNDTFDPDRMAFDREQLRQFYLQEGYADFRVISAVAELTPDRKDFYITFTIEEGEIYDFGEISVESQIRDLTPEMLQPLVLMKSGKRYNAKLIEDTVEVLTNFAGLGGYAFVDIRPRVRRDREGRKMNITFHVLEAPRVYVERVNVYGNVRTLDQVIRREFQLAEGDAFNSVKLERSKQRIESLGFFQEGIEIERVQGSAPDKIILEVNVEERATGELSLGAGFSSLENFLFDFSIRERNLLGRGQELSLGATISSRRKQIQVGFTEPYFLGRNLSAGIDLFRTEFDSIRESSFNQSSTGAQFRVGTRLTEFVSLGLRYGFRNDKVKVPEELVQFTDPIILAAIGNSTTSSVGYTVIYDTLNNRIRPSRGQRGSFSQDLAGLGGSERYVRSRIEYDIYFTLWQSWILRFGAEAGNILGISKDVRLNDRFFLGGPRIRGFDIRGIGPRIVSNDPNTGELLLGSSIGGNNFYLGGAELEVPLGEAARELGLRSSFFVDIGSLWDFDLDDSLEPFRDTVRDSSAPRISVGFGVSWNSPFGPFRIDLAKALKKQEFDETQFLQFNIGTQF